MTKQVLFIGAGRMAQAIIERLKDKNEFSIMVANNGNEERLNQIREAYGVAITKNWKKEVGNADIIFLAMPPNVHESLLLELSKEMNGQLVMTVAAGIGPSFIENRLPEGTPVAWVMPNTAAKLGQSMTMYAPGKWVTEQQIETIEILISGIGEYERVTEQQIIDLTAVTGSAPAFIYRVAEALETMAVESGITTEQARKLVAQMILGAAEMLKTNADPITLADEVASPGGSTAAGLEVLDTKGLKDLMTEAIYACREKAARLT